MQETAALAWHHVRNLLNVMVVLLEEKDAGILDSFVEAEAHLQLSLRFLISPCVCFIVVCFVC